MPAWVSWGVSLLCAFSLLFPLQVISLCAENINFHFSNKRKAFFLSFFLSFFFFFFLFFFIWEDPGSYSPLCHGLLWALVDNRSITNTKKGPRRSKICKENSSWCHQRRGARRIHVWVLSKCRRSSVVRSPNALRMRVTLRIYK